MKIPYHFDFNGDVKHRETLSSLPDGCRHPMPAAKSRLYYLYNDTEILSQQLNHTPFFTEMVEVDLKQSTEIQFAVDDTQIFLFFMISGEVTFQEAGGKPIVVTRNNTFMISVYGSGRFAFKAEIGKHVAFIVNIQRKWLEERSHFFPNVVSALNKNTDKLSFTLNQYRMDKKVTRWVEAIINYSVENPEGLDGHLRKYISYILKHYDRKIAMGDGDLSYDVKTYLDEHYCNPGISVGFLAGYFNVTPQTLLNRFKRQYNITIQDYYTGMRMEKAMHLMKSKGLRHSDVFDKVGYLDVRPFRATLLNYLERKGKNK